MAGVTDLIFGGLGNFINMLGNIQTNVTNRNFQAAEAQKNRDFQQNMMQYQNAWNLEQWNRQNDYDSPVNQRKLLEEAGYNPAGNQLQDVSQGGGLQSATPQGGMSPSGGSSVHNPMEILAFERMQKELNLLDAQADSAEASARLHNEDASLREDTHEYSVQLASGHVKLQNIDVAFQPVERSQKIDQIAYQMAETQQRIDESNQRIVESLFNMDMAEREYNLDVQRFAFEQFISQAKLGLEEQSLFITLQNNLVMQELARAANSREEEKQPFILWNLSEDGKLKSSEVTLNEYRADRAKIENAFLPQETTANLKNVKADTVLKYFKCFESLSSSYADIVEANSSRRNAATNERNAATNERNAGTNERKAKNDEKSRKDRDKNSRRNAALAVAGIALKLLLR
ncbi:minor capsid protein [Capybara microvirus Cap1_SP_84]|nr:minor capsid protein [Capybara microvirus Cap1_SP_84]